MCFFQLVLADSGVFQDTVVQDTAEINLLDKSFWSVYHTSLVASPLDSLKNLRIFVRFAPFVRFPKVGRSLRSPGERGASCAVRLLAPHGQQLQRRAAFGAAAGWRRSHGSERRLSDGLRRAGRR